MAVTVYSLFEQQVKTNPDSIAISFNGNKITYKKLAEESDKIAYVLNESGVKQGDIVGVCLNRSAEMIIALLGIIKSGAAYLPLDPFFPDKRLEYMLNDSAAGFIITESLLFPKFSYYKGKFIDVSEIRQIKLKSAIADKSDENNLAYVIYTSGSTGNPKGVQIAHNSLTNFLLSMQKTPGMNKQDNILALTTLSFDISGLEIFLPLITGSKITIATRDEAKNGKSLLDKIRKEKVTVVQATPSTWKMMIDSGWKEKLKLKALCGGEPLPQDLADKLLERVEELWNMYGPTETTIWSSCSKVIKGEPIHLGKPIANTQFYIVDKDLNFCPPGVAGELLIGGAGLSNGYLNKEDLTKEKFINNPFDKDGNSKVYRTGDLVKLNSKMQLEFLGRIDNQVKIRGYRIELEEIENVIKKSEAVKDCAVVVKEINNDKKIVAYCVLNFALANEKKYEDYLIQEWLDKWKFLYDSASEEFHLRSGEENFNLDRAVVNQLTKEKKLLIEAYEEWLNQTVNRIKRLNPKRLLEIGCGAGQIIMQIAPICEFIAASDFSDSSIKIFDKQIKERKDFPPIKLFVAKADDDLPIDKRSFDTVVINSVAQYFPGTEHLLKVINKAIDYLSEDGCLYIGDIQSYKLLENFHLNDQLNHISQEEKISDFLKIVHNRVENEEELVIDPEFFYSLPSFNNRITRVEVKLRRGNSLNETTQYHYDVFVYTKNKFQYSSDFEKYEFGNNVSDLTGIESLIANSKADIIYVNNILNKRISLNLKYEKAIKAADETETVSKILSQIKEDKFSLYPEDLWKLSEKFNCRVELVLPANSDQSSFDAVFIKNPKFDGFEIRNSNTVLNTFEGISNRPLHKVFKNYTIESLKRKLIESLPDYMIPAMIVPIDEFPLTPNNKVDKKALTERDISGIISHTSSAKAETENQKTLVEIWENLLGITGIGIDDNFFELGGHSILAAQMLADFEKATGKKIPLAEMFTSQTIRQLAAIIEKDNSQLKWSSLVEIRKGDASLPPLFLVHGAEGNIFLYRDLAKRLNSNRTVYGIQARGLNGEDNIHQSIEEMAADYIKAIKSVHPKGPYHIGGYCMGGSVAYEMALQLSKNGDKVANIFLLETYNACLLDSEALKKTRIKEKIENIKFHFDNVKSLSGKEKIAFIQSKTETALKRTRARINKLSSSIGLSDNNESKKHITLALREINDKAQMRYSPKIYKGKVVLLRPKVSFATESDPKFGWGDFVEGELKIYNLDVAPRGMLSEPFVKQTSEIIDNEMIF